MKYLLVGIICLMPVLATAKSWQISSPEHQMALLELFTSEGCGQCPPAEQWVAELPQLGIDEQRLIVLAFHVDYLDEQKGWVDAFARPEFTARQRQLARLNLFQSVFTPEFVLSGEVVHNWRQHLQEVVLFVNDLQPEADIALQVEHDQTGQKLLVDTHVLVEGENNQAHSSLYLAVKQNNLHSHVTAGDNAGQHFNHQHVVRRWLGPYPLDREMLISVDIPIEDDWQLDQMSLVAVVQNLSDAFVLQAVALPLEHEGN